MSIKATIVEQIIKVAREHDKVLAPLSDDLALANLGLDSLGFAVLVARLEDVLGFDPFEAGKQDPALLITFGDFVKAYQIGAC